MPIDDIVGEFSGCLYEKPTPDGEGRDWRVDPTTGTTYPFDLTTSEISSMDFSNVPIKIEHTYEGFSCDDEVGRVREVTVDPTTGYTAVKFALHDTIGGRTVARLVNDGVLNSLSLGHMYDPSTGGVAPSEVSVCFNGARPGSCLYKEIDMYDRFKASVKSKNITMSSVQAVDASPDTIGTGPENAGLSSEAPAVAATSADVAAALGGCEVENAPSEHARPKDLVTLLESVTAVPGVNEKDANALYEQIADIVSDRKTRAEEYEKQRGVIANLQKQVDTIKQQNSDDAKKIVACMNALLAEYVGGDNTISTDVTQSENWGKEVASRVPVLASALNARKNVNINSMRENMVKEIVNALSPFPSKEEPAAQAPSGPPAIAVNASGRSRPIDHDIIAERPSKSSRFAGLTAGQQEALSGFGKFGDGTAPRLTRDMLPTNFSGVKN